jgi:hypothetical protein
MSPSTDQLTGDKRLRLQYKQWDDLITRRYGVVIEGWPLKTLHKPSDCKNRGELQRLLDAVNSSECKLRKLSVEEWSSWKENHVAWKPAKRTVDGTQQISATRSNGEPVARIQSVLC